MLTTAALTGVIAHPGWGAGGGFGWWFLLIPFFWLIVVVALFAIFGRRWRRGWNGPGPYPYPYGGYGQGQPDSRSAEKTLAERYAQGDIDEVEYRARLEVLRANRDAAPPAG
jgi:putative membrane protein